MEYVQSALFGDVLSTVISHKALPLESAANLVKMRWR